MKRTTADIRENLDHVGCDNETALELCDEIERMMAEIECLKSENAELRRCSPNGPRKFRERTSL
jgi:hypothetical protein